MVTRADDADTPSTLMELLEELSSGVDWQPRAKILGGRAYRVPVLDPRWSTVIVKGLDPDVALRSELLASRFLPAACLSGIGPAIEAVAVDTRRRTVWHVYTDYGDCALDEANPQREAVGAVMAAAAQLHARFAGHPMLGECRAQMGDRSAASQETSLSDATRVLGRLCRRGLRPPTVWFDVCERLVDRFNRCLAEAPMREVSMPETLLHGDLWPKNTLCVETPDGLYARLVDWDRSAVGPLAYDLSAFLLRSPKADRPWIWACYLDALGDPEWERLSAGDLNKLFEAAEVERIAEFVISPALAAYNNQAPTWAFEQLAAADDWIALLEPVLPEAAT